MILIDSHGNGVYVEKTMKEPIDAQNPDWITTRIPFKMGEQDAVTS